MTDRPRRPGSFAALLLASTLLAACAVGDLGTPDVGTPTDVVGMDATGSTCSSNAECAAPTRFCDPATHHCAECIPSMDMCPTGQVCDPATLRCAQGCRVETDCRPTGPQPDAGLLSDGGLSPVPTTHCETTAHRCVQCLNDDQCPSGAVCMRNACVTGCSATHPCPSGRMCCSGVCADTQRDARNCGACNRACDTANNACCNGRCANTTSDAANCGACGATCMPTHAMGRCMSSACALSGCENGWSDADGMAANGCECALDTNGNSCGMATDVGTIAVGMSRMVQGNLLPTGSSDWLRVTFSDGGSPHVRFAMNPGMTHRIDVQTTCLSSDVLSCMDSGGTSSAITDWEFTDTAGMHLSRDTPLPTMVYVRVFSATAVRTCMNYQLTISN